MLFHGEGDPLHGFRAYAVPYRDRRDLCRPMALEVSCDDAPRMPVCPGPRIDVAFFAGDPTGSALEINPDRPSVFFQRSEERSAVPFTTSQDFLGRKVANPKEDLHQFFRRAGFRPVCCVLEPGFDLRNGFRLDDRRKRFNICHSCQEFLVEGGPRRPRLFVHVGGHKFEEEACRKGGRSLCLDRCSPHGTQGNLSHQFQKVIHVEHITQHFAGRLHRDREILFAPDGLQEIPRLQPLKPERRSSSGDGFRHQEGACGVVAELPREEGGSDNLFKDNRPCFCDGQVCQKREERCAPQIRVLRLRTTKENAAVVVQHLEVDVTLQWLLFGSL